MRSFRRVSIMVGTAALGAGLLAVVTVPSALAADTCGDTYTWTGAVDTQWAEPANWTVRGVTATNPPGMTAAVSVPSGERAPVLSASADDQAPTELCTLSLGVGGTLTISGFLSVDGPTTVGAGARLSIGTAFYASGELSLGSGSVITSTAADSEGALSISAGIALTGNATLSDIGVGVDANRQIATAGHTLTLTRGGVMVFGPGDSITSTRAGGSLLATNVGGVALMGNASIGTGASLKIADDGVLATARSLVGAGATTVTLGGGGALNWAGGSITGAITLANPLRATVVGSGKHVLLDTGTGKTRLTNKSAHFVLAAGSLVEHDANTAFRNAGTVTQSGGSLVAYSASAPSFANAAGARWTITARAGRTISVKGSLANSGVLTVPAGVKLKVAGTFKQASAGRLALKIGGTKAGKHAAVAAGKLSLGGKLQLQSVTSYRPKAGVKINAIVKGSSRHGKFKAISSKTYRKHTKWTVAYTTKAVTAKLIKK